MTRIMASVFLNSKSCYQKTIISDQHYDAYPLTVQKSGTHLLKKILNLLEIKWIKERTTLHLSELSEGRQDGKSCKELIKKNRKYIVLYRDPRDCVISQIFHKKRSKGEGVKILVDRHLLKKLTIDKLITKSLTFDKVPEYYVGCYAKKLFESLSLVRYFIKHPHPSRLLLRFEDLVPAFTGGADEQKRFVTFKKICEHFGKTVSDEKIREVMEKCWGGTATFRETKQKKVGQWVNYFTPKHIKMFQRKYNHLLLDLGYETDPNWHEKYLNPPASKPSLENLDESIQKVS